MFNLEVTITFTPPCAKSVVIQSPKKRSVVKEEKFEKEKKYRGKLERTELISVTFPPMDRLRPLQQDNLALIESTTGFQVDLRRGLAPTGTPKNLKGIKVIQQERKIDADSRKPSLIFTLTFTQ